MRGETQGPYDYGDTILTNAAKQELVSKAITVPLKSTGQAQMANFVVSNTSKNKEKSVEFLGLLNSDPELLNGLVWGIEGEAWKKASLSGPSDYDAVVREATTGAFFVFSWQESNHSAPNGKSFG